MTEADYRKEKRSMTVANKKLREQTKSLDKVMLKPQFTPPSLSPFSQHSRGFSQQGWGKSQ